MASEMGTGGGLVRPESGNVEKVLVLPLLFEGSREPNVIQECKVSLGPDRFWSKKLQKRSKKETNEPLDMKGKYDAYMFGLGGPKTKMLKNHCFF